MAEKSMWKRKQAFEGGKEGGAKTDKELQEILTVGEMEESSLWLKSGARGDGGHQSRRLRPDSKMICVKVGRYLTTLPHFRQKVTNKL